MQIWAPWLLAAWAAGIALADLRWRRIPNAALAAAVLPVLAWLLFAGHGPMGAGWAESLAGGAIGTLVWLPGYGLRAIGAGDVKFAAAIGLALGAWACAAAMLVAAVLLGAMAAGAWLSRRPHARLPAGVALAGGMLGLLGWMA